MKKLLTVFLFMSILYASGTCAALKKVVAYPAQAQLFYQLDTQLTPGVHTIIFRGLPHAINKQSIRWDLPSSIQLLSWETKVFPIDPSGVPTAIQSLYDSVKHYTILVDSFSRTKKHYMWMIKMLEANRSVKGKEALLWEDIDEVFNYFDQKNRWLLRQISIVNQRLSKAQEKQRYWQERWQAASRPYLKEGEIALHIRMNNRKAVQIRLDFLVSNAAWSPEYRITAMPNKNRLSWMLMGNIRQTTGKDWHTDTLILTNATPHQYLYVPRLTPWYLLIREPGKEKAMRTYAPAAAMPESDMARATGKPEISEQQSTLLHEFRILHPPVIPSTGTQIPMVLRIISPEATFEYHLYPSRSRNAILTARVRKVDQYRLIKAPAKVFINGRYNGQVSINPFTADNELTVALGNDERIRIQKKLLKKERRGPSLGGTITVNYRYQYTLKNHYSWEVKTLTIDQIPISTDRRVKVSTRPGNGVEDAATGIIKWPYSVNANSRKSWTLDFSVSYPKDLKVVNLP